MPTLYGNSIGYGYWGALSLCSFPGVCETGCVLDDELVGVCR